LSTETERISELVKRADSYNKMDREERREAIFNLFKKNGNNSDNNSQIISQFRKPGRPNGMGGGGNQNEVEALHQKLTDCKLPPEAQKIVDQEFKKLRSLDPRN